ncbi:MAG: HAD family hydrolase [Deltaproteobacteria bacterium]|nr:MAG: HAD family hydrolase [Deltaproteobacteria bacterium]
MTSARAIFCDFDGTITQTETFVDMLRTFAPAEADRIIPQIHDLKRSLHDGVTTMLQAIPSDRYEAAIAHADPVQIRPGFAELVEAARAHDVPFVVVSGGLYDMVVRKLGPLAERVTAVYAVHIDTSGSTLQVRSPFSDGQELVAKVEVMREHPARERVAIGDSTTDLQMSMVAERVFARRRLCDYLDERGKAYTRWQDFHDIHHHLAALWGWPCPSEAP